MLAEIARRFGALPFAQRARWGALVPLGLASALLEGLGGAVVFALLTVILSPAGNTQAAAPGAMPAWLEPASGLSPLTLAITAAAIHLAKNLGVAVFTWWRARAAALDTAVLRTRLLRAYVDAPWSFHLRRSSAVLMENMHSSARAWFDMFEAAATILTESAVIVALGIVVIAAAPVGVSVSAAVLFAAIVLIVRLTRQATRHGGEQSASLGAALYRHVQHSLGAAKEIIILGRGRFFVDSFERDAHAVARLDSRRAVLDAMPRLVLESAFVVGMLALIAAGAATGSVAAMLPLVSLYAYAGFRVIPAAHRIALQANNLRWSLSASAGLAGDLARLERAATVRRSTDGERLPFRTELTAVDVSFAYEGSPAPVLTHVDVAIRRGESVAIVGATGAGKTTLVDLLIGLLTPSGGRVTVDGTPIDAACAAWQRNIGYVPQNPFMLDDTLRRNIALGIRDEEIDERAVAAAMRLARLEGVAERLPNGLDTSIGEHGVRLSGGERQRVSIARALYHDPALLIFDEATSSLDPATERDIAEAIEPLRGGRTIVVIAHRLSTVERCDRVLLLDRGRIAAAGPYGELAAGNAAFRALAAL